MHDHSYTSLTPLSEHQQVIIDTSTIIDIVSVIPETSKPTTGIIISKFHLDKEEREFLEMNTRAQSSETQWFQAR